jgi:hypothetical protein
MADEKRSGGRMNHGNALNRVHDLIDPTGVKELRIQRVSGAVIAKIQPKYVETRVVQGPSNRDDITRLRASLPAMQ